MIPDAYSGIPFTGASFKFIGISIQTENDMSDKLPKDKDKKHMFVRVFWFLFSEHVRNSQLVYNIIGRIIRGQSSTLYVAGANYIKNSLPAIYQI